MSFGQELKDFVGAFGAVGKTVNDYQRTQATKDYYDAKTKDLNKPDPLDSVIKSGRDSVPQPDTSGAGSSAQAIPDGPTDAPPDNFSRNKAYIKPGMTSFSTALDPDEEKGFRGWVSDNKVPFDPDSQEPSDYDMRGFYRSMQSGGANPSVDPNDGKTHYPDTYKTPYHETFSNESEYATPDAPHWNDQDQLIDKDGNVQFDDRAKGAIPDKAEPDKGQSAQESPEDHMIYLVGKSKDPKIAAALLGNAWQESGLNPTIEGDKDKGGSFGLYQFNANGRKPMFDQWTAANKRDPSMADSQHDFVLWDLQKNFPKVWQAMQQAPDAAGASDVFMTGYERPNPKLANSEGRRQRATEAFKMFEQPSAPAQSEETPKSALDLG